MKRWIQIYVICFIIMALFFFCGGSQLFYFSGHPYRTAASIAFVITVLICIFIGQEERMDEMEARIKELEAEKAESEAKGPEAE